MISKKHAEICNLSIVFAYHHNYYSVPCFGVTDSIFSVSLNTFSVGEVSDMKELGDYNDGERISDMIRALMLLILKLKNH